MATPGTPTEWTRASLAKMRNIPVDLILHELVERLLSHPDPDNVQDKIATHCIDSRAVAEQWSSGAGVAQFADWLLRRLDFVGEEQNPIPKGNISAEARAMEVAVARRLADVGLALLVTQDAEDRTAAVLLLDASRLVVGLERDVIEEHFTCPQCRATFVQRETPPGLIPSAVFVSAGSPKFKVGDRVRFAHATGPEHDMKDAPPMGWEGVVTQDDKSYLPLEVTGESWRPNGPRLWWFVPEALDLVTPV